jgi:acyl-CoA thioester hydrolase
MSDPVSVAPTDSHAFSFAMRVYWEDTDAGGVVFYANFLKFFERARTEWLRSLGHQQEAMRVSAGLMFVVCDTAVRFLRPARLDDLLRVTVHVTHAGRAQLTLTQQAWRSASASAGAGAGAGAELLAEGTIRIGCVDTGTFRPARIPTGVRASLMPSVLPSPSPSPAPAAATSSFLG